MKIAYLIDRDSLGGGMEYIRRKIAAHPEDECRVFFSGKGECRARNLNDWRADAICAVHLRALLQALGNPFSRPKAPVTFAVLGLHIRKYDHLPRTFANRVRRFARWCLENYLYRRCHEIVVQNKSDAAEIARLYGKGLKVSLDVPSLGTWSPPGAVPARNPMWAYLYVARFEFQKGQDRWLEYVARHADRFRTENGITRFVGCGSARKDCQAFVRKNGLEDLIQFEDETTDIESRMLQAGTIVSASRWEGYPYLLMKARALGCKILATDCPGNRDVLAGYEKWDVLAL